MSEHFVCTGECGGVSDKPKVCDDPNCSMHGQSLQPCDCADGKHYQESGDEQEWSEEEK